ncbi:hypothetical protein FS837_006266, partial [Tulasnella sp. UAMH 9824]
TEEDAFATGLIPFYIVFSNAPVVFLFPAFVLFSTTPPPAPRPHPTPVPAPYVFDPLKPYWEVSYDTFYNDEQTLHNMAIGRPLNGTAKCVTKKVFSRFDPNEFAASPFSEDDDAPIEAPFYTIGAPFYSKYVHFRMLDPTAWGLVPRVELLRSRAITSVPWQDHVLAPSRAARRDMRRLKEQSAASLLRDSVYSTVADVFKAFFLIVTPVVLVVLFHLAPLAIRCLVMLNYHLTFDWPTKQRIVKPADIYRAVSILALTLAKDLWNDLKSMVVARSTPYLKKIGLIKVKPMRPKFVPESLFTEEEGSAFRKAYGLRLPWPVIPPCLARIRIDNIIYEKPKKKGKSGMTYEDCAIALAKVLKRLEPKPVEPSILSPAGAALALARKLAWQKENTPFKTPDQPAPVTMPPKKADEAQEEARIERPIEGSEALCSPMKITPYRMEINARFIELPVETYEEFMFFAWQGPGERPDRPAKQEDVKTAASGISRPNIKRPFTSSLGLLPAVNSKTSSSTLPKSTEESSAKDATGKSKQAPTPTSSEPSEHTNSDAGLAGQVNEEIFDESLLETPRPGCNSLPRATKNTSQASNPSGPQHSDVRPAAQLSRAGSQLRTPKPEVGSVPVFRMGWSSIIIGNTVTGDPRTQRRNLQFHT